MTSSNTPDPLPPYTVVYTKRRSIGIAVERDGALTVRAPKGTDPKQIHRILESKRRWISEKRRHPQKYDAPMHPPGKELVSGETMLFLGRDCRVELVREAHDDVELVDGRFLVSEAAFGARGAFHDWYVKAAKEHLLPRARAWARSLGVQTARVSVVEARFRWGSCTPAGNIRLNWRLVKAPPHVADYVIVHEMAHLLEPNHGQRFWSIVRSQVANVDGARAWLREHGQLLEGDL